MVGWSRSSSFSVTHPISQTRALCSSKSKPTNSSYTSNRTTAPFSTTMKTRSQSAGPSAIQVPSSESNSSSPPSWRCENRSRLHRGDIDCTASSPPSSPIIDTPEKRKTFERKQNARQLQDSQATEPTPSRAATLRPRPQARIGAAGPSATPTSSRRMDLPTIREDRSAEPGHHNDYDDGDLQLTPEEDRIPETPLNLPSSPPLPLPQLTADNLSLLEGGGQTSGSSGSAPLQAESESACGLPPASTIVSLPAYVTHQISYLVQRSRINAQQHIAVQKHLAAMNGDLTTERERVRSTAARGEAWEVAFVGLVVLCLAYAVWCWFNSVEFEFIDACHRAAYGL
jgi:hypothetical protein